MKPAAALPPVLVYTGWKPPRRFNAAQLVDLGLTMHQQLDGLQRGDPGAALLFAWVDEMLTWSRVAARRGLGEAELGPALALVFTLLARWADTGRAVLQGPQEYQAVRLAVLAVEALARAATPGAVADARDWARPHAAAARRVAEDRAAESRGAGCTKGAACPVS